MHLENTYRPRSVFLGYDAVSDVSGRNDGPIFKGRIFREEFRPLKRPLLCL